MKRFIKDHYGDLLIYLGASLILGLSIALYAQIGRTPFPEPTTIWKVVDEVKARVEADKSGTGFAPKWTGNSGPFEYEVQHLPKTVSTQEKFLIEVRSPEIRPRELRWLPDAWILGLVLTETGESTVSSSVVAFRELEDE